MHHPVLSVKRYLAGLQVGAGALGRGEQEQLYLEVGWQLGCELHPLASDGVHEAQALGVQRRPPQVPHQLGDLEAPAWPVVTSSLAWGRMPGKL
jgi:hypothetical protein